MFYFLFIYEETIVSSLMHLRLEYYIHPIVFIHLEWQQYSDLRGLAGIINSTSQWNPFESAMYGAGPRPT
jgi:hypothetical protein